jgi:hypothetical protein
MAQPLGHLHVSTTRMRPAPPHDHADTGTRTDATTTKRTAAIEPRDDLAAIVAPMHVFLCVHTNNDTRGMCSLLVKSMPGINRQDSVATAGIQ